MLKRSFARHPPSCRLSNSLVQCIQGYLTSLMGNAILLSYFVGKRESGAAIIQAIGVVSNFVMLGQVSAASIIFLDCGMWLLPNHTLVCHSAPCLSYSATNDL